MSKRKPDWKNRIIEYGEMPANQYLAHELNARRHPGKQREALIGSLNEVGWVAPVIVSARTGKLLDGHARIEETLTKDEEAMIPFVKVDVSENEERTILASFDPITGLATYDREALDALLREVSTGEAALQEMLSDLALQNNVIDFDNDLSELFVDAPASEESGAKLILNFQDEDELNQVKMELSKHGKNNEIALKKLLGL
jgi:hypothetical protein